MDGLCQPRHESHRNDERRSPWQNWLEENCGELCLPQRPHNQVGAARRRGRRRIKVMYYAKLFFEDFMLADLPDSTITWCWSEMYYHSTADISVLFKVRTYVRRGRVDNGVGHLAHGWGYGVREVVSSNADRGNIVGGFFHPTRWLARFSLIWKCLSFPILNLFRTLSSWESDNYRPLLYEVASHVKQLPFRPILYMHTRHAYQKRNTY